MSDLDFEQETETKTQADRIVKAQRTTKARIADFKIRFVECLRHGLTQSEAAAYIANGPVLTTYNHWRRLDTQFDLDVRRAAAEGQHLRLETWKDDFLELFRDTFNLGASLRAVSVTRTEFNQILQSEPDFARAFYEVRAAAVDNVESALYQKALSGGRGAEMAAAILLNAYRPKRYKRKDDNGRGSGDMNVNFNFILGPKPDDAKRLPAQTGKEIILDVDDDTTD